MIGAGDAGQEVMVAQWTRRLLAALVAIVMFAMMILTTADVAGRALFNAPIRGNFEIITFLLAILVFASLPLITWDESHITVSLFDRWIAGRLRKILRAALSALSTAIVAAITYRMWIQAELMAEGQHITGLLEWPIAPIVYIMSALSALTTVILAVLTWQKIIGRDTDASAPPDAQRGNAGAE